MFILRRVTQLLGFSLYSLYEKSNLRKISLVDGGLIRIYFLYKMVFEQKNLKCIEKLISTDAIVLDIGAGFGFYTIAFAKNPRTKKVHSFEPSSVNFARCQRVASKSRLNDRIELNLLAISNQSGTKVLRLDRENPANHSVEQSNFEEGSFEEVLTVTVDDYCQQKEIRPNFIKLDVQGHELQCLIGARRTLEYASNLFLLIELDFENHFSKVIELVDYMNLLGYSPFVYSVKTGFKDFEPSLFSNDYIDVIFVKTTKPNHV